MNFGILFKTVTLFTQMIYLVFLKIQLRDGKFVSTSPKGLLNNGLSLLCSEEDFGMKNKKHFASTFSAT